MLLNRFVLGLILVLLTAIFVAFRSYKASNAGRIPSDEMIPNVVVIKFNDGQNIENNTIQSDNSELNDLLTKHSVISLDQVVKKNRKVKSNPNIYDLSNIYYASFSGDQSPAEVAANLEASPLIEYSEPKFIYYINAVPNDSLYYLQKAYYNIIEAPQAWDVVQGGEGEAIIAIVDGGTDIRHSDLANNIWINETEVNGMQGVDDDGNGYIDDTYGWNFANKSGDPTGLESTPNNADHGTFTAGIVSAINNNLTGVSGVSWNATVMAINAGSVTLDGAVTYAFEGIIYAANNGADVINCSWTGHDKSKFGRDAVRFATSVGAVVVAAAGNFGNSDPYYPASFADVLSIAATDTNDNLWDGSNYGPEIDLAAPGVGIFSTLAKDRYGFGIGTSAAASLVSGVVGLVMILNPGMTGVQAGEQVRLTADSLPEYTGQVGRGRINAYRALTENPISISLVGYVSVDENNNQIIESGERIELRVQIINYQAAATTLNLSLSTSFEYITFINDQITLPAIGTLEQISLSDPFVFDIAEYVGDHALVTFELQIEADGYRDQDRFTSEFVGIPNKYNLKQNYPNPFNPSTVISWQLAFSSNVELIVYNLLGQKVATLVSERQAAGLYQVEWYAREFASGIYYYRIQVEDPVRRTGEFQDVKKMILLK